MVDVGTLQTLDTTLFRWGNERFAAPPLDPLMAFASGPWPWVILGVCLVAYVAVVRSRRAVSICLMAGACVGLADAVETYIFKPFFGRLRPCYMLESVRLVVDKCGGNLGLPSGHSTNAMALAVLFGFIVPRRWSWVGYMVALVIGFSRIYVGVHFPGDVLSGFVVGAAVAAAFYFSLQRLYAHAKAPPACADTGGETPKDAG
jgi:undecaprenyl-diphosphatase